MLVGSNKIDNLLAALQTFMHLDERNAAIRIISARLATKREQRHYENMP